MSDIVERLRYDAEKARRNWPEVFCVSEDLAEEAADEIEKLQAALQWLVNDLQNHPMSGGLLVAFDNARAALGEKE
jgi:hypothetical protein